MVTHAPLRNIPKGLTMMARISSVLHKIPMAATVMLAKCAAFMMSLVCNEKQSRLLRLFKPSISLRILRDVCYYFHTVLLDWYFHKYASFN